MNSCMAGQRSAFPRWAGQRGGAQRRGGGHARMGAPGLHPAVDPFAWGHTPAHNKPFMVHHNLAQLSLFWHAWD